MGHCLRRFRRYCIHHSKRLRPAGGRAATKATSESYSYSTRASQDPARGPSFRGGLGTQSRRTLLPPHHHSHSIQNLRERGVVGVQAPPLSPLLHCRHRHYLVVQAMYEDLRHKIDGHVGVGSEGLDGNQGGELGGQGGLGAEVVEEGGGSGGERRGRGGGLTLPTNTTTSRVHRLLQTHHHQLLDEVNALARQLLVVHGLLQGPQRRPFTE
mmetsp:Transcript_1956/g.2795  ORF Transcript_1956/g.2795 Transcript_1956/m.2795 type:complete len:212 (-) Transcript_1956:783-1418(-)